MRARLSLQGGHRRWGKVVDAVRLTAGAAMVPFAALLSALSGIPDPRRSQGRRYPLAHLLLSSVLAVLAGANLLPRHPELHRRAPGAPERHLRHPPAAGAGREHAARPVPGPRSRRPRDRLPPPRPGAARGGAAAGPAGHRPRRQDPPAQLRPPARRGRRPRAERLRQRGGADPGPPRGAERPRRGPGRAGAGRRAGPDRRAPDRRRAALPKNGFAAAAGSGNALLVRVKGNQPGLHDALAALCAEREPSDRLETVDRGRHGRQEHRRVEVFEVGGRLDPDWRPWIACAARVTRLTWRKDTRTGLWV